MTLMAINGNNDVPGDVYAWTIVFILPVNSALNPWLYTLGDIRVQSMGPLRYIRRRMGLVPQGDSGSFQSSAEAQTMVEDLKKSHLILVDVQGRNSASLNSLPAYLQQQAKRRVLSPAEAYKIVLYAARSLNIAHYNGYTLPNLGKDNVLVCEGVQGIQDVFIQTTASLKFSPQLVTQDVQDLGNLVKSVLRLIITDGQRRVNFQPKQIAKVLDHSYV